MKNTRNRKYTIRMCVVCMRSFRASRKDALTCSDACRKVRSRAGQRKRANQPEVVTLRQLELLIREHGF